MTENKSKKNNTNSLSAKSGLEKINSPEEYLSSFEGKGANGNEKNVNAYEKAWDARKFEINNY